MSPQDSQWEPADLIENTTAGEGGFLITSYTLAENRPKDSVGTFCRHGVPTSLADFGQVFCFVFVKYIHKSLSLKGSC